MKSEVWKIVINSVSLGSESTDTKLHKNTPALLPHLSGGNTHTPPEICSPCYQAAMTEAGDPQGPVFQDKSGNSCQSAKDQAQRRCCQVLTEEEAPPDRQTPTSHL